MIATIDQSVTDVALPAIRDTFDVGVDALVWVQLSGALPGAAIAIQAGGLGDRFGKGRVILVGIALFLAGSMASAFAIGPHDWAPVMLIAGRFVSGAGDTVITVLAIALLTGSVPATGVPRMVALWTTITSGFAALAPLFSGLVVDSLGWRFVFGLPAIPLLAVAAVLLVRRPEFRSVSTAGTDWVASSLLALAMLLLTASITSLGGESANWSRAGIAFVVAAALLGLFVIHQNRSGAPLIRRSTLSGPGVTPALIGRAAVALTFGGAMFLVSMLMLNVLNYPPSVAGAMSIPPAVASIGMDAASAPILGRIGVARAAALASLAISAGIWWLSTISLTASQVMIGAALTIVGAGNGLLTSTLTSTVLAGMPHEEDGEGSGILLFAAYVPGVVGFSLVVISASLVKRVMWTSSAGGRCGTDPEVLSDLGSGAFSDIADTCGQALAASARAIYLAGSCSVLKVVATLIAVSAVLMYVSLRGVSFQRSAAPAG